MTPTRHFYSAVLMRAAGRCASPFPCSILNLTTSSLATSLRTTEVGETEAATSLKASAALLHCIAALHRVVERLLLSSPLDQGLIDSTRASATGKERTYLRLRAIPRSSLPPCPSLLPPLLLLWQLSRSSKQVEGRESAERRTGRLLGATSAPFPL
jgi:hypothetical protein